MLERKQILPIGSTIAVCYRTDGGNETILQVVGHLTMRRAKVCLYDYVCVYYPQGIEDGLVYINHTDIVRVVDPSELRNETYDRWLTRKYGEYLAYYNTRDPKERPDIDTTRREILIGRERERKNNRIRKWMRIICAATITLGAGLAFLLTKRWEIAVGALFFAFLGSRTRK